MGTSRSSGSSAAISHPPSKLMVSTSVPESMPDAGNAFRAGGAGACGLGAGPRSRPPQLDPAVAP
eukprot:7587283-Pyramimonas_sp.AAC.1